jgi:glycerophosphoryl diester phosphodiesterase
MKNLSVFFWTMKDDEPHLLPPQLPSIKEAYYYLFSLGVHGIITEFP